MINIRVLCRPNNDTDSKNFFSKLASAHWNSIGQSPTCLCTIENTLPYTHRNRARKKKWSLHSEELLQNRHLSSLDLPHLSCLCLVANLSNTASHGIKLCLGIIKDPQTSLIASQVLLIENMPLEMHTP
jgi:hypothetical protein